ncbi:hypothetical protein RUND412_005972 [Rhizina undulata]
MSEYSSLRQGMSESNSETSSEQAISASSALPVFSEKDASSTSSISPADSEAIDKYNDLITHVEDLIVELAGLPHQPSNVVKINEVGSLLTKLITTWETSKASYSPRWPSGKEQVAFIKADAAYKLWRRDQQRAGRVIPEAKETLSTYDLEEATDEEVIALMQYHSMVKEARAFIIEAAQKENYSREDDILVKEKGGEIRALINGWEGALKQFGSIRQVEAFEHGYDWARICRNRYLGSLEAVESGNGDMFTGEDSDMEMNIGDDMDMEDFGISQWGGSEENFSDAE